MEPIQAVSLSVNRAAAARKSRLRSAAARQTGARRASVDRDAGEEAGEGGGEGTAEREKCTGAARVDGEIGAFPRAAPSTNSRAMLSQRSPRLSQAESGEPNAHADSWRGARCVPA
ncbi:hypothetical protein FKP32DRAFT_1670624, partial [Trametes sanguinea]